MGKFMISGLFGAMHAIKAIDDIIKEKKAKGEQCIDIDELQQVISEKTVEGMDKFLENEEKNDRTKQTSGI